MESRRKVIVVDEENVCSRIALKRLERLAVILNKTQTCFERSAVSTTIDTKRVLTSTTTAEYKEALPETFFSCSLGER